MSHPDLDNRNATLDWAGFQTRAGEELPIRLYAEFSGSGEPLLLVHGFGANLFSWRFLAPLLAKKYRVIQLDLKGHGRSPKPASRDYSIYDHALAVLAFIRQHDLRGVTLLGHSLGGGIALALALYLAEQKPERLRRLVLIGSAGYKQRLPWFIAVPRMFLLPEIFGPLIPIRLAVRLVLRWAVYDKATVTPEMIQGYAAASETRQARHAIIQTARFLIPQDLELVTRRYSEIQLPALVVWGDSDRIVPLRIGQQLARDLPQASLQIVERCGHIPHEEYPEQTGKLVEKFLSET